MLNSDVVLLLMVSQFDATVAPTGSVDVHVLCQGTVGR